MAQKLLMTLIVQNESNRPGRARPDPQYRSSLVQVFDQEKSYRAYGNKAMARRLLIGDDYSISLTDAQKQSFERIFTLICEPCKNEIPMEVFSAYVNGEAKALGSQIGREQFMNMIDNSGIDEDGDGVLTLEEFLSFLRGLFLADIPSKEVPRLRTIYDAAVAEAPDQPFDESRAQILFANLGFDVESVGWQDVMGVIDADGDGDVDFNEFLTGIGMMKKFYLLSYQLDAAFRGYKMESIKMQRSDQATPTARMDRNLGLRSSLRGSLTKLFIPQDIEDSSEIGGVEPGNDFSLDRGIELGAGDLERFLTIPRKEAEEMVFLADQDEVEEATENQEDGSHRTIDRDEFQQLIRSWS